MLDRTLSIGAMITASVIFANVFMFTGAIERDVANNKEQLQDIKEQQQHIYDVLLDIKEKL